MIIIDDLHDYFNLDNYHDCWLIGDHMTMNMGRDYDHADWFALFALIMMRNMTDDLVMIIDHDWWMMISVIDDDLS